MATYYVRPGGNDSNAGTGPATNQAWATIQKALSNTSGVVGGDIIYVAPGHYLEQVVVGFTSPSSTVQIIGDVTASQFTGLSAGIVRLSGFASAGNTAITYSGAILKGTSKNNLSFSNFIFEGKGTGSSGNGLVTFLTSQNISFSKCLFSQQGYDSAASVGAVLQLSAPSTLALNATVSKCVFETARFPVTLIGNNVADTSSVKNCIFFGGNYQLYTNSVQVAVINNVFSGCYGNCCDFSLGSSSFPSVFRNNLFLWNAVGIACPSNQGTEDYNRFIGTNAARSGIGVGSNSSTVGSSRLTYGYLRMVGLAATDFWSPEQGSPNQGFGTATGAEATDVYSTAWTGTTPDAGYQTYSVSSTLTPTYQPTERNASTITIAPGSTSQSIELYLGATGLAFNTSGLQAYYIRNRSAPVAITLVTQTATGAWTSGGFAEISSSLTPGVYRLDVPNAAFASGATDVTLVVRGAAGTNGAVVTVTLSAGGLSSTETAQAVWNATASSYNTAGSMGEAGQRLTGYSLASSQTFSTTGSVGSVTGAVTVGTNNDKTGYSLSTSQTFNTTGSVGSVTGAVGSVTGSVGSVTGSVGSVTGAVGSVTSAVTVGTNNDKSGYSLSSAGNTSAAGAVWNSARSTYTSAGTFGQYVNAELVTPVSQGSLVYMGPYQVIADGVTTPQPLDIQKGAVTGIGIQLVDNNLSGISITGATVTTKVYNAGGSLVATYACTATYAADGRASFIINTTVTNVPGTYTATITRTTGASDTQVFGPLRIYVRDI